MLELVELNEMKTSCTDVANLQSAVFMDCGDNNTEIHEYY